MRLHDLVGARIERIGTVSDDDDGETLVWLYLDQNRTIGLPVAHLSVASTVPYTHFWSDFGDFLEDPEDYIAWWDEALDNPMAAPTGTELRLAHLKSRRIEQITAEAGIAGAQLTLHLEGGLGLILPATHLIADGPFESVWEDLESFL